MTAANYRRADNNIVASPLNSEPAADDVVWQFHPDRRLWFAAGFRSWFDAAPWRAAGFDAPDAALWNASGFTPGEALDWIEVIHTSGRLSPAATGRPVDSLSYRDKAVGYRRKGHNPIAVKEWAAQSGVVLTAEQIDVCIGNDIEPHEAGVLALLSQPWCNIVPLDLILDKIRERRE